MERVINKVTGEVNYLEEVKGNPNEIIEKKLFEVGAHIDDYIDMMVQSKALEEQMQIWRQKYDPYIVSFMKELNIKKYETKYSQVNLVLRDEHYKLDTEALKNVYYDNKETIYDHFKTKKVEATEYLTFKEKE